MSEFITKWYSKLVAKHYDRFMQSVENRHLSTRRKNLLQDLKGTILEVGAGTGVNFQFYDPQAQILACEPDSFMATKAREKATAPSSKATISLLEQGVETLEIAPNSLDYIVCTLVLCTIPKPFEAYQQFKSWLKSDGELIILEHIAPKSKFTRFSYDLVTPIWKRIGQGCHLNRNTDQDLKSLGFSPIQEEYFQLGVPFYQARMHA